MKNYSNSNVKRQSHINESMNWSSKTLREGRVGRGKSLKNDLAQSLSRLNGSAQFDWRVLAGWATGLGVEAAGIEAKAQKEERGGGTANGKRTGAKQRRRSHGQPEALKDGS